MAERPLLPKDNISILHPGMRPSESPVDWQAMSADQFLDIFERMGSGYLWVAQPDGAAQWSLRGTFTTKSPRTQNRVFTRLSLLNDDDEEIGHVDLDARACISMARNLISFAISSANVNAEHSVISDQLVDLLGEYLAPARFSQLSAALALAAEEQVAAKLRIKASLNAKG